MTTERIDNPFTPRRTATASSVRGASGEGRAALPLRAMTGYEEEVVEARQRDANTAALCNEIVARCAVAPGADFAAAYARVRALSTVDRDCALIRLRQLSLGDVVRLVVACPSCRHESDVDFTLSSLPLPSAPVPEDVAVALPPGADAAEAVARIPTAGDQEDLLAAGIASESARLTFLLARVLVRYGEATGPFDEAFVRALPVGVRSAIERALDTATPGLDLSMAVQCAACDAPFAAPFDVAGFFLPR